MGAIFGVDSKFSRFMGRVADLIILNLLCVIFSLPVFTIGASLTAMHTVTLKMCRNEEAYIARGFVAAFKQNFKQATIINVIMLLAGAVLYVDITFVNSVNVLLFKIMGFVFWILLFLYFLIFLYVYPVLAKFDNTIFNTFKNSLLMAVRHLPFTLLMGVITLAPYIALFFITSTTVFSTVFALILLIGFALTAFINGFMLRRIFDHYIPAEEESTTDIVSADSSEES